jgi:sensor histidine kinase YesM
MLNLNKNSFRIFAENWGLPTHEFTNDLYSLSYNKILLATNKGFYSFNPDKVLNFPLTSNIQFSDFKIFNKEIISDFSCKNEIKLNYDENFFTIQFSDLNYLSNQTTYLYKLKGVDKDWVTTSNNSASYTKILPGKYLFLVNTPENIKNNIAPKKLTITITPPYWQTTWFYVLEFLLVILILLFVYTQRNKQFKLKENHLKLEQRLLRLQMNPHFLFNSLTAIQSFIFKNNPKEAGKYLSKFAKLMRLFLQSSREEFICLNREIETLSYYMEMQQLRFNNSFDYNIACSDNIDTDLIKIPPMMAQPFIENAIEHGFNNINYKGYINVEFDLQKEYMQVIIEDNGVGINNNSLQENTQKSHKSLATIITKDRLKAFSNTNNIFSMQIINLKDISETKSGTKIVLNVPYKNV